MILHGFADAYWNMFRTRWRVQAQGAGGQGFWTGSAEADLRIENLPSSFTVSFTVPAKESAPPAGGFYHLRIGGEVAEHLGRYMYGEWFREKREQETWRKIGREPPGSDGKLETGNLKNE